MSFNTKEDPKRLDPLHATTSWLCIIDYICCSCIAKQPPCALRWLHKTRGRLRPKLSLLLAEFGGGERGQQDFLPRSHAHGAANARSECAFAVHTARGKLCTVVSGAARSVRATRYDTRSVKLESINKKSDKSVLVTPFNRSIDTPP